MGDAIAKESLITELQDVQKYLREQGEYRKANMLDFAIGYVEGAISREESKSREETPTVNNRSWKERLAAVNPDAVVFDGFDDALIGMRMPGQKKTPVALYSIEKCITILINEHEMQPEDAREYFYYNVFDCHTGPFSPIFLDEDEINASSMRGEAGK